MDIEDLRKKINRLDKEIIKLISERSKVSKKIGIYKRKMNLDVIDKDREKWLAEYRGKISVKYSEDPSFIEKIFSILIKRSKKVQKYIRF